MNFLDKLNNIGCYNVEIFDYIEIKINIDLNFFGKKTCIDIWFSDYDLTSIKSQDFILNSLHEFEAGISLVEIEIDKYITRHIKSEYSEVINSCFGSNISLSSLTFGGDTNYCISGSFCLGFSTGYEREHGLGVILKKWRFYGSSGVPVEAPRCSVCLMRTFPLRTVDQAESVGTGV